MRALQKLPLDIVDSVSWAYLAARFLRGNQARRGPKRSEVAALLRPLEGATGVFNGSARALIPGAAGTLAARSTSDFH